MLMAIVLICSLTVTPDLTDCSAANAVSVMRVPENFSNSMTCLMHGQAYLASTTVGRDLVDGERVKILCMQVQGVAD